MRVRTAAFAVFGLAAAMVIAAIVVNQLPGGSLGQRAALVPPAGTSSASPLPGQSGAPKAPPAPGKFVEPTPGSPFSGQEQQPSVKIGVPYALPTSTPRASLVESPLPKTADARGSIVAGFPSKVIPLAQGSQVTFTSVTSEKNRLQVGLDAMSSITPSAVLDFYRAIFDSAGLTATAAPAVGGSTALAFVRGANTVTVTASPSASGSHYVVYGVFLANT